MLEIEKLGIRCTGCETCQAICPRNAISTEMDEFGFFYPKINSDICIMCRQCEKKCPTLYNKGSFKKNVQETYAAWNCNEKIRKNSTSGGVFSALASFILQRNGIVFGAAFNDNMQLSHIAIDKESDMQCLRGSKYIHSHTATAFIEVKKYLEDGKIVLFSGTPCQVDGLKHFINGKTNRLYTIDLVCHGVGSSSIFYNHINSITKKTNQRVTKINFRDKSYGWLTPSVEICFENGRKLIIKSKKDHFMNQFYNNLIIRPSCHECQYACRDRVGDITLGDFWGINKQHPEIEAEKGISLVLINSDKGKELLSQIADLIQLQKSTFEKTAESNHPLREPCKRNKFSRLNMYFQNNYSITVSKVISNIFIIGTKCFRRIKR